MSIWNYIGEFLLFRWLYGKFNGSDNSNRYHHVDTVGDLHRHTDIEDYAGEDYAGASPDDSLHTENNHEYRNTFPRYYNRADIYDDEDDALDDYDPTDGDDGSFNGLGYGCDYYIGNGSQTHDDFLDEHDDYDLMDDDF